MTAEDSGQAMTQIDGQLPRVQTPLDRDTIVARLFKLSKRGKLAGFTPRTDGPLFDLEAHGLHFDFQLVAIHDAGTLRFELRPLWKTPLLIAAVTLLAAGPGLWLTHSMMLTYFSWYELSLLWTAAWYEPLTIVPIPWMVAAAWKKSRIAAMQHARESTDKIALELGATKA